MVEEQNRPWFKLTPPFPFDTLTLSSNPSRIIDPKKIVITDTIDELLLRTHSHACIFFHSYCGLVLPSASTAKTSLYGKYSQVTKQKRAVQHVI